MIIYGLFRAIRVSHHHRRHLLLQEDGFKSIRQLLIHGSWQDGKQVAIQCVENWLTTIRIMYPHGVRILFLDTVFPTGDMRSRGDAKLKRIIYVVVMFLRCQYKAASEIDAGEDVDLQVLRIVLG